MGWTASAAIQPNPESAAGVAPEEKGEKSFSMYKIGACSVVSACMRAFRPSPSAMSMSTTAMLCVAALCTVVAGWQSLVTYLPAAVTVCDGHLAALSQGCRLSLREPGKLCYEN